MRQSTAMSLNQGLSLGFSSSGAGGIAPVRTDNILVASRTQFPNSVGTIPANFTSRRSHYSSPEGAIINITCLDMGMYLGGGDNGVNSDPYTIKRYLEYPANTFHQVLWAGLGTKTVAAGSLATSDVVLNLQTGLPLSIPANTQFWERTVNLTASVTNYPRITLPAGATTLGLSDGNSATDQGNSGTIPASSSVNYFGCAAFKGTVLAANARSAILHGDSIVDGFGDISSTGAKGGSQWWARGIEAICPYTKISLGGQTVASYIATNPAGMQAFIAALSNTSDVFFEAGINDISIDSASSATLLANMQTLYTRFSAYTGRKWQATLTTRTSSTNAYADAAGQTQKTDGSMATAWAPTNTAIRALPAQLYGYVDAAAFAEAGGGAGTHVWGAPFPPTTDGTHDNSAKAAAMALLLPAAIAV